MLGRGVGLAELVEAVGDRALAHNAIARWLIEELGWDGEQAREGQSVALFLVIEISQYIRRGQFHFASKDDYLQQDYWPSTRPQLDECPAWRDFTETRSLAERIDSFLGVLESDARLAPLAADCRAQLDLLGVLADLCEDAGLPHAAAEARHLHALAGSMWRG